MSINLWFDENLNHRDRACSTFYNVLLISNRLLGINFVPEIFEIKRCMRKLEEGGKDELARDDEHSAKDHATMDRNGISNF